MSNSLASASSTRASDIAVVFRTASKVRVRPSQLTNVPAFSTTGATGKTTFARRATRGHPDLEADQELDVVESILGAAAGRTDRPGRRRPRSGRRACRSAAAATMPSVSRPGALGSTPACRSHSAASSARAAASCTGRPPGIRFGRQPASIAPRSPARRGTQASFAPVRAASAAAADSAPWASGEPLADDQQRSLGGRAPLCTDSFVAEHLGLVAGNRADHGRGQLLEAARGERRDRVNRQLARGDLPCAGAGRGSGTPPPAPGRRSPPRWRCRHRRSARRRRRPRWRPGTRSPRRRPAGPGSRCRYVPSTTRVNFE